MELGNFSVSLTVKDLARSRAFYESLGFERHGGDGETYLMMKSGDAILGLFQGMFERNILTFNPKWDSRCQVVPEGTDVREIRDAARAAGLTVLQDNAPGASGPGNILLQDPDGNPILVDQHV